MSFKIELNKELAAVLLRCLAQGSSTNHSEALNGFGSVIEENVQILREQVAGGLANEIITETAEELIKEIGD